MHNLSKIKIDNKSNTSSLSVILKKEHRQKHMLTNNNLHIVYIVQGSRFFIICHIHNHTGYNQ